MKNPTRVLIAIATFNEMENIRRLVPALRGLMPEAEILVVDDDSPDRTWQWVQEAAKVDTRLSLIHRRNKSGLGSATIAGLRYGIENGFDLVATMDADFSHPPGTMATMIQAMIDDQDVDALLGSRYVEGGRIEGWPVRRRVASKTVNFLARAWLGLRTYDNTGAMRVYRRSSLETIDVGRLRNSGYAYLEEILLKLQQSGARIVETPITFRDRECGKSKAGLRVGLKVVAEILAMRFRTK